MMRKIFWILLLGNMVLYAMMHRSELGWVEPKVQGQPLNAEKIRLLDSGLPDAGQNAQPTALPAQPAAPSATKPATIPATPAQPVSVSAPIAPKPAPFPVVAKPVPVKPAPAPANVSKISLSDSRLSPSVAVPETMRSRTMVCLEWGDFSGLDLARATTALAALHLGDKLGRRQMVRDIGYWVYIPPLKDKAAVNKKIAELKARKIREYFVVQSPAHLRNAISLGVFKTQEAAQHYLNSLRAKNVHSAQVGSRASKLKTTIFTLNGADAATRAQLAAMQKDFAGSELNNIPCNLAGAH